MLLKQPFFGTLLMTSPLVETHTVPTAATDMRSIFYNPDFFAKLTDDEVIFVLAHEVLHIAFKHGLRMQTRDRKVWNYATDYQINAILAEQGFTMPEGGLLDTRYSDRGAEVVYDELMQKQDDQGQGQGQGQGQSGDDQPGGGLASDLVDPADMSAAEQAQRSQQIDQQVAQAANMARMAGKLSGSLERAVSEVLDPAAPWYELLRDYMTRNTNDDETWSRRNRRFGAVYLPSRHNQRMGEIVVIGDTSGSITEHDINRIASEVSAIADVMQPERIRMVWADTEVKGEQVFEVGEPINLKPVGYGGTDMRVPIAHVEQYEPVVAVMVTDGYTPWPAEPSYPLIVCCTTSVSVPIGQVVRV
jgi:predicted metal-dependent peptidase